jgi:hypothetical protein
MTQFGTVQLGRLALVEIPKYAAVDQDSDRNSYGRTLSIQGQESSPGFFGTTAAQLAAKVDDLVGMIGELIPATFSDKADRNGYYTVATASASLTNWEGETESMTWSATLTRVGTPFEIDLESRLTGAVTRNTSFPASAATGSRSHTPPIGAYGYWSGPTLPSAVSRSSEDGTLTAYTALPITSTTRWGCSLGNYPLARVRFLDDNGIERSGTQFQIGNAALWTLKNALVNVTPISSGGVMNVASYTGGAYQTKNWDLQVGGVSLGAPVSVSLLRNEYELCVVRLLWTQTPGRVTADLTLRRGSRLLELYIQTETSSTIKVVRGSAEAGSSAVTGYVTASANDGAGNKYIIGGAHTFTADTANGGISLAATTTLDAFVGVVAGGTGAVTGDKAADLYSQYLGFPAEQVRGTRR